LTDIKLKSLKPTEKLQKVAGRDGIYAAVTPAGLKSFRYDYRVGGRRETFVVGRYDETLGAKSTRPLDQLAYGISMTLAEARVLLAAARLSVEMGESPSKAKIEKREADVKAEAKAVTFDTWVQKNFAHKADPKSGGEQLSDSTLEMRKSNYRRIVRALGLQYRQNRNSRVFDTVSTMLEFPILDATGKEREANRGEKTRHMIAMARHAEPSWEALTDDEIRKRLARMFAR
jgi:hypothetical protein